MRNKDYIKMVNNAVKEGRHNRPIKVIITKNPPSTGAYKGVASHINMKHYDRIAIWSKLATNETERKSRERVLSNKLGEKVYVITRDEALRHELWHVHKPYASEKEVRTKLEKKPLPNELPTRRRI
jgi:hypothetical protein